MARHLPAERTVIAPWLVRVGLLIPAAAIIVVLALRDDPGSRDFQLAVAADRTQPPASSSARTREIGRFSGVVQDLTGNPVPSARVVAVRAPGALETRGSVVSGVAGARGRFEIAAVDRNSRYLLRAFAPGYCMSPRADDGFVWRRPTNVDVTIRMQALYVAVIGVRSGEVDLTYTARAHMALFDGTVSLPRNLVRYAGRVPGPLLPPAATDSLAELSYNTALLLACAPGPSRARNPMARLALDLPGFQKMVFDVVLRPVGGLGSTEVQWLYLPESRRPAWVSVSNSTPMRRLRDHPVFLTSGGLASRDFQVYACEGQSRLDATVPPGAYSLHRVGFGQPAFHVNVKPGESVIAKTDFGGRFLVVNPRDSSGAAARDVGIYFRGRIRTKWKWLLDMREPFGCGQSSHSVLVHGTWSGAVQVRLRKRGFQPHDNGLKMLATQAGDVEIEPVLSPAYGR